MHDVYAKQCPRFLEIHLKPFLETQQLGPQVPTLQGCGAFGLLSFIIAQVVKRLT